MEGRYIGFYRNVKNDDGFFTASEPILAAQIKDLDESPVILFPEAHAKGQLSFLIRKDLNSLKDPDLKVYHVDGRF